MMLKSDATHVHLKKASHIPHMWCKSTQLANQRASSTVPAVLAAVLVHDCSHLPLLTLCLVRH